MIWEESDIKYIYIYLEGTLELVRVLCEYCFVSPGVEYGFLKSTFLFRLDQFNIPGSLCVFTPLVRDEN